MGLLWYCINKTKHAILQRFAWGMAGGSITGMQCFVKDALTVLKVSRDKRPWKLPWTMYIMTVLAIATAVGGLSILTRCMKRYDVTFSNAMNAGSFVVSASIMSAVHYKTFANLSSRNSAIMYPLGLAIILVGLWILVRHTREAEVHQYNNVISNDDDDTISSLRDLKEEVSHLELTTVEQIAMEESAGLVPRRGSATRQRGRTESASSVEDNYGLVHRPSFHGFANRDRTASSSSMNRDRTGSASSVNRDRTSSASSLQF